MFKSKKLMSLVLAFTLACSMATTALAEEATNPDASSIEKQPKVIIQNTDLEVPEYIIEELMKDNPDAGEITITEFSGMNQSCKSNILPMQPMYTDYYSDVNKIITESSVLAKDVFVTSVARGQTQTLSSSWSSTLSCNISGKIGISTLGITASLTKSYSITDTFSGPPESSSYNCREYRVKFYEDRGTYTANLHTSLGGWVTVIPESGNWSAPVYYLAYSLDKNIN